MANSSNLSRGVLWAALDLTREAVLFVDAATRRCIAANRAAEILWGAASGGLGEKLLEELVETNESLLEEWAQSASPHPATCKRLDGATFAANLQLTRHCEAEQTCLVLVIASATSSPAAPHERLDDLTGLPSRSHLQTALAAACQRAQTLQQPFAIFFLDLDDFKQVNDQFGHLAGDEVLRTIAQRLTQGLRPRDLIVRFGGDEFVALLDDVGDAATALQIAERLRQRLQAPIRCGDAELRVTASLGIALSSATAHPDQLLHTADQAMYAAKQRGGAGHVVLAPASENTSPGGTSCGS